MAIARGCEIRETAIGSDGDLLRGPFHTTLHCTALHCTSRCRSSSTCNSPPTADEDQLTANPTTISHLNFPRSHPFSFRFAKAFDIRFSSTCVCPWHQAVRPVSLSPPSYTAADMPFSENGSGGRPPVCHAVSDQVIANVRNKHNGAGSASSGSSSVSGCSPCARFCTCGCARRGECLRRTDERWQCAVVEGRRGGQ